MIEQRYTPLPPGDQLVRTLAALANPQRLRILALLAGGRQYVSQLAREVGLSRPLVHMHLKKLEGAGLVVSNLELSEDGKAMRYFDVAPFSLALTPETVLAAAAGLTDSPAQEGHRPDPGPSTESGGSGMEPPDSEAEARASGKEATESERTEGS